MDAKLEAPDAAEIRSELQGRVADCRERHYSHMTVPVSQVEALLRAPEAAEPAPSPAEPACGEPVVDEARLQEIRERHERNNQRSTVGPEELPGLWRDAINDRSFLLSALASSLQRIAELEADLSHMTRRRDEWRKRSERLEARLAKMEEALTPSGDTKAAYMGEFSFNIEMRLGRDYDVRRIDVPWPTIKEIMAAIRARAALSEGDPIG